MRTIWLRALGAGVVLVAAGTLAAGAGAAPGTRVAFVVDVSFSGSEAIVPGTSSIPGCASATVTTEGGAQFAGPVGRFFGTKVFDCGTSGTFTLAYNAHTFFCSPTDSGSWMILGGTGIYAGMTGQGQLTGIYYDVVDCQAGGVYDGYTGTLKLAG